MPYVAHKEVPNFTVRDLIVPSDLYVGIGAIAISALIVYITIKKGK